MGCLPLALAWPKERRSWIGAGLLCMALPVGLGLGVGYAIQPGGLVYDLRTLTTIAVGSSSLWLRCFGPCLSFYRVARAFPPFMLGLFGLGWLLWQDWRARKLSALGAAAVALLLGGIEVFRQRQNLETYSYPLILALPAFCLGLGVVLEAVVRRGVEDPFRGTLGLLAGLALFIPQPDFHWMEGSSAPPALARDLLAKAKAELKAGDLVLGQAALNWGLPVEVRACQWEDLALAQGEATAFFTLPTPKERFRYLPRLEDARWLIVSPYSYGFTFGQASMRALGLRAEQLGFRPVWNNAAFAIFERPPQPGKAAPGHLLAYAHLYDQAAFEALRRGDLSSARFALRQALPLSGGDPAARLRLLKQVEKKMGLK
jgi:hypothetical protein